MNLPHRHPPGRDLEWVLPILILACPVLFAGVAALIWRLVA